MGSDFVDWLQARDWNQFSAIFLGAFLAFVVGIAVQEIMAHRTKRASRRMLRQLIGIEVLNIMEQIDYVARLVQLTRDERFVARHSPTSLPHWETLAQCLGTEGAIALTPLERADVRAAVANLRVFVGIYEHWEQSLNSGQGMMPVLIGESNTTTTYVELKTRDLFQNVDLIQTNLLDTLISVCNLSQAGQFHDDEVEGVRKKLTPTRPGFPKKSNFVRAYRSSLAAPSAEKLGQVTYLVVWKHDWPECPVQIIELEPARSKEAQPALHMRAQDF
jgi:hypothetical protein